MSNPETTVWVANDIHGLAWSAVRSNQALRVSSAAEQPDMFIVEAAGHKLPEFYPGIPEAKKAAEMAADILAMPAKSPVVAVEAVDEHGHPVGLAAINSVWLAADGRRMRVDQWIRPTFYPDDDYWARLTVLNPGYRQKKSTEMARSRFGTFLQPEPPQTPGVAR